MNHSRRELLNMLGYGPLLGLGANFALASCGKSKVPDVTTLAFWGTGTLDIGEVNWKRSEGDARVKIDFTDNGNDLGPVLAAMIGGTAARDYDIGGVQGGTEPALFKAGAILPWDLVKLPALKSVVDWLPSIKYLNSGGQQIGLPIVANADSIIYRESVTGKVESYASVFDPKFKGRASMEDSWMNSVVFTAIYMKFHNIDGMARIGDVADLDEPDLRIVIEFLKRHKRDGQFYKFWNGWDEGVDLISSGKVVVMTGWEPIVYKANDNGLKDVKYATPVEGFEGWSNNLILHSGVRTQDKIDLGVEDAAHRFANWQLTGYYGCVLGALRGYLVPTPACVALLDDGPLRYFDTSKKQTVEVGKSQASELLAHVQSKFDDSRGKVYWQNARPRNFGLYEKLWAELRAVRPA